MHQLVSLWEIGRKYASCICEKNSKVCMEDRVTTHRQWIGFELGRCEYLLIVACMETSDWVNLCVPDSARNTEGGSGTYSWLGSRQAVQNCGHMRDKPISTASVETKLTERALRDKILVCVVISIGRFCHELVLLPRPSTLFMQCL